MVRMLINEDTKLSFLINRVIYVHENSELLWISLN